MNLRQRCPECRQGKHQNCTGMTMDADTEETVWCSCADADTGFHFHGHLAPPR